jgi:hypothetical protein
LSIARLRNLAILTLRTLAPFFTSLRLLKLDSSRRMLSRLLASKTTLPWRESSDIPFKENDFKLELVRFTVNSASRNLMQSRDKDSRLLQLAMNDWSCNADASTLCSLRDNKHRNRWARMGDSTLNLISVCQTSKLWRHLILAHLSNKFT